MTEYLTLIHDHWRSTRKYYLFSFAVAFVMYYFVLVPVLNKEIGVGPPYPASQTLHGWLMVPQGVWVLLLLIASGDNDNLSLRLPRYLMRLPVGTWKIVCARLTFGALTNTLFALVCYSVASLVLPERLDHYGFRPSPVLILLWPLAYLSIQAYAWCFGSMGIIATLTSFFACFVAWNGIFYDFQFDASNYEHYTPAGVVLLIAISFFVSILGIGLQREGRAIKLPMRSTTGRTTVSSNALDSDTFASPAHALRWYQMRDQSTLYPKITIPFAVGLFLIFYFNDPNAVERPSDFFPLAIYFAISFCSLIVGTMMLFRGWGRLMKKDGIFLFVRPLTSMELITARWEANAKAILLTILPLAAIAAIALSFDTTLTAESNIYAFAATRFPEPAILFFTLSVVVMFCAVIWGTLWIENLIGMCIIGFSIAVLFTGFVEITGIGPQHIETYGWVTAIIAMFLTILTLFIVSLKRNLISMKHLKFVLTVSPFVCAGAFVITNLVSIQDGEPMEVSSLPFASIILIMIVVAPLITGPAITQWARHRK